MVSVADTMAVSAADMMAVSAADMTGSVVDPIISVEAVTTTFAEWMADSADVVGADAADSAKVGICLKALADPVINSTTRMETRGLTILITRPAAEDIGVGVALRQTLAAAPAVSAA